MCINILWMMMCIWSWDLKLVSVIGGVGGAKVTESWLLVK